MKPNNQTIHIYAGATLRAGFLMVDDDEVPVPLDARSARMQVREDISSPLTKLDLDSADGTIALGADGLLEIRLDADATAALAAGVYEIQNWVYDLEIITPGAPATVDRVLTGVVVVYPEITR